MKYTGNLNLKKPEGTDIVNIDDLNENIDILDLAVAGKVDKVAGKGLSDENFTTVEKNKLAGIATGANNYTHPANHPASIIIQDASNRFVTDTEKANWNAKETPAGAQTKVDAHANNTTTAHGATSAATANKIIIRDAVGRAKVAAPSAADDIARKDTVDAVQTNLTSHANLTTTAHGGIVPSSDVVTMAMANKILKLNANAKLPASITGDADTLDTYHAGNAAGNIPINNGTLNTNLNAQKLNGQLAAYYTNAANINIADSDGNFSAKKVENAIADLGNQIMKEFKSSVTLPHGISVLNVEESGLLRPKFVGRQLINLLGRDGNCENITGVWLSSNSAMSLLNNGIKAAQTGSTSYGISSTKSYPINNTKYYIASASITNLFSSARDAKIYVRRGSDVVSFKSGTAISINPNETKQVIVKIQPSDIGTETSIYVYPYAYGTNNGESVIFDNIMLCEILPADYNLNDEELLAKYPYVNSFQCVQNPAIRVEGENLLPPFNQWNLHANAKLSEPYTFVLDATANSQWTNTGAGSIKVIPGQKYSFSCNAPTGTLFRAATYDKNGIYVASIGDLVSSGGKIRGTLTIPAGIYSLSCNLGNNTDITGSLTFSNPILVVGDVIPTEFKPYNPSYLYLQTPLYEGETLEKIDGQWMRTKKWEKKVLNASLAYSQVGRYTGYNRVKVAGIAPGHAGSSTINTIAVKYDGKLLPHSGSGNPGAGDFRLLLDTDLYITIPNVDSGWADSYAPTPDEIKAYFMGWKMCNSIIGRTTPYNGTGTKGWVAFDKSAADGGTLTDGIDFFTVTPPSILAPNTKTKSYVLHYQLLNPIIETVPSEGQLVLHEGVNQVEVFEGVVFREIVNPTINVASYNYYGINTKVGSSYAVDTGFNALPMTIYDIYKNGRENTSQWTIAKSPTSINWHNGLGACISKFDFDPSAQYSVTYLAVSEEFTASLLFVDAIYDANIKSIVDSLVSKASDVGVRIGALEQVFTSVSNGKNEIATAITDKGIPASSSESFASLAGKIGNLTSGISDNIDKYLMYPDITDIGYAQRIDYSANYNYYDLQITKDDYIVYLLKYYNHQSYTIRMAHPDIRAAIWSYDTEIPSARLVLDSLENCYVLGSNSGIGALYFKKYNKNGSLLVNKTYSLSNCGEVRYIHIHELSNRIYAVLRYVILTYDLNGNLISYMLVPSNEFGMSSLDVSGKYLYVINYNKIIVFNTEILAFTGWQFVFETHPVSLVAGEDDYVYARNTYNLYKIKQGAGTQVWYTPGAGSYGDMCITPCSKLLCFNSGSTRVYNMNGLFLFNAKFDRIYANYVPHKAMVFSADGSYLHYAFVKFNKWKIKI
ncbi:hypothetical protein [Desulfotomaculum sp. 1211_IL3151]|uniref:hypothetical protein n=1 Tax=Desulfotomaculum sp. 1211_IL3151 TaxID=3084055 RepID=UPI002FDB1E94